MATAPNPKQSFRQRLGEAFTSIVRSVARPFLFAVLWCLGTAAFGHLTIWVSLYIAPQVLKDFHPSFQTFLDEGAFVPFLIAVVAAATVDYHLKKKAHGHKHYTFIEIMATLGAPALWMFYVAIIYGLAFQRDPSLLNHEGYQNLQLQLIYGSALLALVVKMFYYK